MRRQGGGDNDSNFPYGRTNFTGGVINKAGSSPMISNAQRLCPTQPRRRLFAEFIVAAAFPVIEKATLLYDSDWLCL